MCLGGQADPPPRDKMLKEGGLVMQSGGLGIEMPGCAEGLVSREALSHTGECWGIPCPWRLCMGGLGTLRVVCMCLSLPSSCSSLPVIQSPEGPSDDSRYKVSGI